MKRIGLMLAFAVLCGVAAAHASKPFESHFAIALASFELSDKWLPSGTLKQEIIDVQFDVTGDWVGLLEQHGFATTNPNGVFYALAWATFTGSILCPDGNWYTGTVNILVHNVLKFAPDGTVLDYWVNQTIEGGGTGELANVRGHGTEDLEGNVTWWLHFEP